MNSCIGRLAAFLAVCLCVTGCGGKQHRELEAEDKLNVVTTIFPYYDFARQIAGDRIRLSMVVPAGMDSHSFEPTPADMELIQHADVLIANGGAMEHWLTQVLDAVDTSHMKVITMMDYVDAFEEEIVEGMEDEDHGDHGQRVEDGGHGHGEREHSAVGLGREEYDEHIWTSPKNAVLAVGVICGALKEGDPSNADFYQDNADLYQLELRELDVELKKVAAEAKRTTIVVADKYPFRYLSEEYGWDYRAAFSGCSTDTEPSAKTIAYLIDRVRDEKIPAVYYLELSSHRVAEIIGEETGAKPLLLHSCHNITRAQFDSGVTYLDLMRQNVKNLREGLDE